jgi:ditrans,polycis-polyprenyl diphosphate synthase
MDGNRRYAKSEGIPIESGHNRGSSKLQEILDWSLKLKIPEVSVFAFALENFNRSEKEVDCLMTLATEKFTKMLDDVHSKQGIIHTNQVKVCFIGNLQKLPSELRNICTTLQNETSHFNCFRLNVMLAYNSSSCKDPVNNLDLLVRTSGETRLSDFMIDQITSETLICFINELWPNLSLLAYAKVLLRFHMWKKFYQPDLLEKFVTSRE